jgi:hypothetical protein
MVERRGIGPRCLGHMAGRGLGRAFLLGACLLLCRRRYLHCSSFSSFPASSSLSLWEVGQRETDGMVDWAMSGRCVSLAGTAEESAAGVAANGIAYWIW